MKKKFWLFGVVVILAVGALFVNAAVRDNEGSRITVNSANVANEGDSCNYCSNGACPVNCGGSCGVESCGCS